MKNVRLLWEYMEGKRLLYIGSILGIAVATIFSIINPLVIRTTIDSIIGDQPLDLNLPERVLQYIDYGNNDYFLRNLILAGIILVIFTALRGIFLYYKGKWSAIAAETIARNLRDKIYDHLQHLSYEYHVKIKTGDLIQRCTSDIEQIRMFLATQLVEVGRAIFILSMALFVMLGLHIKLTVVAMCVIPFIIGYSYFYYKVVKKTFKDAEEAEARMSTALQENLTGVRVVRAFARQQYEIEKFDNKSVEYRDKSYRVLRALAWFWSISDLLCMCQIGAVLVLGVYWATMGELTIGTLVVFMMYEGMLLWPIRQMGRILTDLGKTQVAITRIQEVLSEPLETNDDTDFKPEIKGDIEFENVCFAYNEEEPVLKDISFRVDKGQTVAILGPTGSGKSSLVHLLARLYDYQQGSIKIDGHDIKKINKKWLRKHIGLVLQEPFLFARSVKENIRLAKDDADDTEVYEAADNAAVHDVIMDFEKDYDTLVGERGVSLSGGQKQRMAIARTIIRDCPILVFDDSLSAVDTETDARIRKALREKSKDITTFIISHRINTLAEADMILVIKDGRIIQRGTHQELVSQEGMYNRVWKLQNERIG
ncbi:MAG: ABC transporter ATP-binding protein [Halanaerobiaceae bacterium]